jgi:hypothetical protein
MRESLFHAMTQQKPLFGTKPLPMKLKKLTDAEIDEMGIQAFGNLYYYHPEEIKHLISLVQKRLEGKNRA